MEDGDNKKTEPLIEYDVFIVNPVTREVHHKNFESAGCQLEEIRHPISTESLVDARRTHKADPCAYCFRSRR